MALRFSMDDAAAGMSNRRQHDPDLDCARADVARRDRRGGATSARSKRVRVAALGKKGSVSERLKGLGAMSPEERKAAAGAERR